MRTISIAPSKSLQIRFGVNRQGANLALITHPRAFHRRVHLLVRNSKC